MCIGSIRLGVGEEESQSTATGARRHVGCGNSVDTTQAVGDGDHQSWVLEIRDATVDYRRSETCTGHGGDCDVQCLYRAGHGEWSAKAHTSGHVLDERGKRWQEELNCIMMRLQYPLVYLLVSMNRRVRGQCARWAEIGRSSGGTTDQGVRSRASRHLHALRRDSHLQHLAPVPLLSPTATISPVFNTVEASVWPLDSSARPFDPLT